METTTKTVETITKSVEKTFEDTSHQGCFCTRKELSFLLLIPYSTLCSFCKQGLLTTDTIVGGVYLYSPPDIARFFNGNTSKLMSYRGSTVKSKIHHKKNNNYEK